MSGLQHVEDDGARCVYCARVAAGPCASCRRPVCADCCTLTEGGLKTFAICIRCEARGGRSMRSAWVGLLGWVGLVILALAAVAAVLALVLARR